MLQNYLSRKSKHLKWGIFVGLPRIFKYLTVARPLGREMCKSVIKCAIARPEGRGTCVKEIKTFKSNNLK